MKFFISFLCLLGFINFSYSLKASLDSASKIKREELLNEMEAKYDKMKKIQILKDKFKDISPNMEMGNYKQYVLMKPFVELGIKKNLRDVKALISQIEEKLIPYLTQDFNQSKRSKRSTNVAAQPANIPGVVGLGSSVYKNGPAQKQKKDTVLSKVTSKRFNGKYSPPMSSPSYKLDPRTMLRMNQW